MRRGAGWYGVEGAEGKTRANTLQMRTPYHVGSSVKNAGMQENQVIYPRISLPLESNVWSPCVAHRHTTSDARGPIPSRYTIGGCRYGPLSNLGTPWESPTFSSEEYRCFCEKFYLELCLANFKAGGNRICTQGY